MRYILWLWRNSCGIRWNTAVRIVTGIGQVVLGLLMVWFSKRFIDETIRTGTADDVLRMEIMGKIMGTGFCLKKSVKIYNIRWKKCVEIVVIRLKKCIFENHGDRFLIEISMV